MLTANRRTSKETLATAPSQRELLYNAGHGRLSEVENDAGLADAILRL